MSRLFESIVPSAWQDQGIGHSIGHDVKERQPPFQLKAHPSRMRRGNKGYEERSTRDFYGASDK